MQHLHISVTGIAVKTYAKSVNIFMKESKFLQ